MKATIVVVDDSDIVLARAEDTLTAGGYRVLTMNGGQGLAALVLREEPDLVLLDVSMPGITGDMLVRMLRAACPEADTTVLLYSTLEQPALRTKAEECDADGSIRKSSNPTALLNEVDQWIEKRQVALARTLTDTAKPTDSDVRRLTQAGAINSYRPPRYGERPPLVMFVDDDMDILAAYRRLFWRGPAELEFVTSGATAVRRILSATPPDVIVSDLVMPGTRGDDLFRIALRHDPSWQDRFIMVTGHQGPAGRPRTAFFGPLLRKPLDRGLLADAIERCLAFSKRRSGEFHAFSAGA